MAEPDSIDQVVALHDAALAALGQGDLDTARAHARAAVDAAVAVWGPNAPDVANVLLTCVAVEEEAGDFHSARQFADRAAAAATDFADSDEPELVALWVDTEVACARLSSTLGDFEGAERQLSAALASALRVLPADDETVLSVHNMRGITAKYAGRFEDAQKHYEAVRVVLEGRPEGDDAALATLLHNLGGLAHSRGHIAEGVAHAQRGLQLRIAAVGPDHPDVAKDLNALGALHFDAGASAAADSAYRRALAIFENALGPDHYEVAMTCANLAVSTAAAGHAAEARELYERALAILRSCVGPGHPDVGLVQHNMAVLLAEQGDHDGARELLISAEATLADLPADHPRRRDVQATLSGLSAPADEQ